MSSENHNHDFSGIKDIFRKSAEAKPKDRPKRKSTPPFSLRLSEDERSHLNDLAGNQSLGSYIRSRLFGKDTDKRRPVRRVGPDHQKLAQVLAELGRSRLASNMNQLAKSANMGTLDVSDDVASDLEEACKAISHMREMLIAALGLKPEDES